jgi:hypothetical protein
MGRASGPSSKTLARLASARRLCVCVWPLRLLALCALPRATTHTLPPARTGESYGTLLHVAEGGHCWGCGDAPDPSPWPRISVLAEPPPATRTHALPSPLPNSHTHNSRRRRRRRGPAPWPGVRGGQLVGQVRRHWCVGVWFSCGGEIEEKKSAAGVLVASRSALGRLFRDRPPPHRLPPPPPFSLSTPTQRSAASRCWSRRAAGTRATGWRCVVFF